MNLKKAGALIQMLLTVVFIFYILRHESFLSRDMNDKCKEHARVVANALWNFNPEAVHEYLTLVSVVNDYSSIQVTDARDRVFISQYFGEPHRVHRFLMFIGLAAQESISVPITYSDQRIGTLHVVWNNTSVIYYAYILLVGILVVVVLNLYARLISSKRELEVTVATRTNELREVNEALRASESQFRSVTQTAQDVIFLKDRDLVYRLGNPVYAKTIGLTPEDIVGKTDDAFYAPDIVAHIREVDRRVLNGEIVEEESMLDQPEGMKHYHVIKVPIHDGNGKITGLCGIARDITERIHWEQHIRAGLERIRNQFAAISRMALSDCVREGDISWMTREFTELAAKVIVAKDASLWLISPEGDALDCLHQTGLPGSNTTRKVALAGNETLRVVTSLDYFPFWDAGQPEFTIGARDFFHHLLGCIPGESLLIAAIRGGGKTRGFIAFHRDDLKGWESDEITFACQVADQVALTMLYAERNIAEKTLRERESIYRIALEKTGQVIYEFDIASKTVLWAGAVDEILGFVPGETQPFGNNEWMEAIHPDDRYKVIDFWESCSETDFTTEIDYRLKRQNNDLIHVLDHGALVRDETGHPLKVIGTLTDITAHIRIRDALRESESHYRLLAENATDVIWTADFDGNFTYVSPSVQRLRGISCEEVLAKPLVEAIAPESRPEIEKQLTMAVERVRAGEIPQPVELELWQPHQDGHLVWTSTIARVMVDDQQHPIGIIGVTRDISHKREMQRELARNRQRLELALSGADLGVWDWDILTGELQVNERWAGILGYEISEIQPHFKGWENLLHEEDKAPTLRIISDHLSGKVPEYEAEFRMKHKSGHWVWILARGKIIERDLDGKPLRACGTHLDITSRKKAHSETLEMERRLLHSQKLESLGVLAGGIAHDFNNLLMSILGNIDLALHELPAFSKTRTSLEEAVEATHRAADLTKQMLAYSGKGSFIVRPINLSHMIQGIVPLLKSSITKQAGLALHLKENLPRVLADATQVQQIIMNLVVNASEALNGKTGAISVSTGVQDCDADYLRRSRIDKKPDPGRFVFLEVNDNGCGMDHLTQQKIFDPFFTTKFTGRGLGMAAVLGIVRGHRGAILVYSEPGTGTTIKVMFPVLESINERDDASESSSADSIRSGEQKKSYSGLVLLVDDEEPIRRLTRRMLNMLGFDVITAADGTEAVEKFQDNKDKVVLVLLDLTMPKMDGMMVFSRIKQIKPDAKVILSSGYNQQDVTQRFAGKGLAGFVQKPYQVKVLQEAIRQIFG